MKLKEMKIYIITTSHLAQFVFKSMFSKFSNVEIVFDLFQNFMNNNPDIECIVSPANSYGIMNGGYDAAISNYLGWDFQKIVQQYIKDKYYGEQPVGTSFIVDALKSKKLIHTNNVIT